MTATVGGVLGLAVGLLISACAPAVGPASSVGQRVVARAPVTSASGPGTDVPRPPPTAADSPPPVRESFPRFGLSFAHDPAWRSQEFAEVSSFTAVVTFLSSQSLHEPCVTSPPTGPIVSVVSVVCGDPLNRLHPGGLLIRWYSWSIPGLRLDQQPGTALTVGGHPARRFEGEPTRECRTLGGTRSVREWISRSHPRPSAQLPGSDHLMVMDACLTTPAQVEKVHRMLQTVRLSTIS